MTINITNEQRAAAYREVADKIQAQWPKLGPEFGVPRWIREQAKELDPPEARWLRSLPELSDRTNVFDDALEHLRLALKYKGSTVERMEHAQLAAACIVAWRMTVPTPSSKPFVPDSHMTDRELLQKAVISLIEADGAHPEVDGGVSLPLLGAESALRLLWSRHRDDGG